MKKTSQQEILKRKKKQQEHPKLETDDFPRGTKTKTKQKKKKKEQKKKNKQKKKRKTTTTASETPRKIFKCFRRTNFWKTNGRGISLSKTLSFNTFSLPNLQNKVTFFNFHSPYFYFGFCRHMVYFSHYLTKAPT